MSLLKRLFSIFLLSLTTIVVVAQEDPDTSVDTTSGNNKEPFLKYILRPEIGFGVGTMTHLGDVGYNELPKPLQNRFAFHGFLGYHLTKDFDLHFTILNGELYGKRDSVTFQSFITSGQMQFLYNFNSIFKKHKLNPYIGAGVEWVWFSTRLDLKIGNSSYHHWSDGTLRSIPETLDNIEIAKNDIGNNNFKVDQDYNFETNARAIGANGLGAYPTFILGVPVTAGLNLKLTKHLSGKLATTFNFTFSDVLDVTTADNYYGRRGNKVNDVFIYTHGTLAYDFGAKSKNEDDYIGVDYLALLEEDTDGDGVKDFEDECENPSDAAVDEKGCPLDDDEDGVPNYKDDELDTDAGAFVNANGVTLTDDELAATHQLYIDPETGSYRPIDDKNAGEIGYKVLILEGDIPEDQLPTFLALDGIESTVLPNGAQKHTYGRYKTPEEAEAAKKELKEKGFTEAQVIEYVYEPERIIVMKSNPHQPANTQFGNTVTTVNPDDGGEQVDLTSLQTTTTPVDENGDPIPTLGQEEGVIYRIQIGAFSKPVPSTAFKGVPVIAAPAGNGVTRYLTGNYKNYQAAINRKKELLDNGFEGAFIVAYKDGERTSVSGTARANQNTSETGTNSVNVPDAAYSDDVKYRVQIGAYSSTPPSAIINKANNLSKETLANGITRYFSGSFKTYEEAQAHNQQLGISGAFVTAYKTGNKISLQETGDIQPGESNPDFNEDVNFDIEDNGSGINIDPNTVVFKIQLGLFQDNVPQNQLQKYLKVGNVKAETTPEGATRYTSGTFNNINEARQYKQQIEQQGIEGTFIIAFSGENQIPLDDAIKATTK